MLTIGPDIVLSPGLAHQDPHIGTLLNLWEELLVSSAVAAQAPMPNLFSFVEGALFFAPIMERKASSDLDIDDDFPSENGTAANPWLVEDQSTILHEPRGSTDSLTIDYSKPPVGIVFITSSTQNDSPSGEADIGIVIDKKFRGRGYAWQAVNLLMSWIFDELHFRRLQAAILDSPEKASTQMLFIRLGFGHEGTRRRSTFCPVTCTWKDTTYLGMLDTDWAIRSYFKPAPRSEWDELFLRHTREREDLLRWQSKLKRSSSTETVRLVSADSAVASQASETSGSSLAGYDISTPSHVSLEESCGIDVDALDFLPEKFESASPPPTSDSEFSTIDEASELAGRQEQLRAWRNSTADLARSSTTIRQRSPSPTGSLESQWDLLESSSSSGDSSSFDCLLQDAYEEMT